MFFYFWGIYFMKKLFIALILISFAFFSLVSLMLVIDSVAPVWGRSNEGRLFLQGLQTIVLFGLTAVVGIWLTERKNPLRLMSLSVKLSWKQMVLTFAFAIAALPAITMLAKWNEGMELPSFLASVEEMMREMERSAKALTEIFLNTTSWGRMFVNLFVMALLPAVCEEMLFRGWLQRVLYKSVNYHVAIWVAAFIFSAIHFQFYGFVPRMLIGAALGYMYYFTGSLWAPILAHFVNNAVAVLVAFLSYNGYIAIDFDSIGIGETWYLSIASIAVCVALMSSLGVMRFWKDI